MSTDPVIPAYEVAESCEHTRGHCVRCTMKAEWYAYLHDMSQEEKQALYRYLHEKFDCRIYAA